MVVNKNEIALKILSLSGLLVAVVSFFEPRIDWIASLCGFMGNGCSESVLFTFFNLPLAVWGVFFYITLLIAAFMHKPSFFWLTVSGIGVEAVLLKTMIVQNFYCFLCMLNLIVLLLLFVLVFRKDRIWQIISIILIFFVLTDNSLQKTESLTERINNQGNTSLLAVVGGIEIYDTDIEKPIAGKLNKLEKQLYKIKKEQLAKKIEQVIIELEAKEKNLSTGKFLSRLLSSVENITDAEIESHYLEHKNYYDRQLKTKKQTRVTIRTYLQEKRLAQKVSDYVKPLKVKYNVQEYLFPPRMPATDINIENNYYHGPDTAKVSIIVFSDYLCPSCKRAHKIINTVKEKYNGKIKWIFKDFPLKRHKGAKYLAAAARAAGEQGKFREYQDLLFSSDRKPDDAMLIGFAEKLGLDKKRFVSSLKNGKHLRMIEKDIQDGYASGISSTPTLIINGKVNSGAPSLNELNELIEKELK